MQQLGPLATGLLALTLFTMLGGLWHYQHELASQVSGVQATAKNVTPALRSTPAATTKLKAALTANSQPPAQTQNNQTPNTVNQPHTGNAALGTSPATGSGAASGQPANTAPQPATVSLALSINGQSKGVLQLPGGSNQCNVLSQALADNLISSLDMRYSSQYGTEAVYVINGIGDPGTVWWTYTVNGSPPPYGCAYITAHNGDSVNWQYVKN
ncbi:MAG TPA: DUF4430 domain-containing protein [Candidatus Saccharimonadales bacterium]